MAVSFVTIDTPGPFTASSPPAPASGLQLATLPAAPAPYWYQIVHLTIGNTSTTPTAATLYLDSATPATFRGNTPNGNADFLDYASPLLVPANRQLICSWTGASLGSIGTITMEYLVVQLVNDGARPLLGT